MVDALASGASNRKIVEVQVLSSAPKQNAVPRVRPIVLLEDELNRRQSMPLTYRGVITWPNEHPHRQMLTIEL